MDWDFLIFPLSMVAIWGGAELVYYLNHRPARMRVTRERTPLKITHMSTVKPDKEPKNFNHWMRYVHMINSRLRG